MNRYRHPHPYRVKMRWRVKLCGEGLTCGYGYLGKKQNHATSSRGSFRLARRSALLPNLNRDNTVFTPVRMQMHSQQQNKKNRAPNFPSKFNFRILLPSMSETSRSPANASRSRRPSHYHTSNLFRLTSYLYIHVRYSTRLAILHLARSRA